MDFESAFQTAISRAWHHVELNDGYVESETFLTLVRDYYADETYGVATLSGEPDDARRAVRNRAMEIWADDIAPNDPNPGEPVALDAPLTDDELSALDSWTDNTSNT